MEHRAGRPAGRPANVSAAAARRIASRRAVERSGRFAALRVEPVDRLEPVTADRVATTEDDARERHHPHSRRSREGRNSMPSRRRNATATTGAARAAVPTGPTRDPPDIHCH